MSRVDRAMKAKGARRGRTRAGRLARVDAWLAASEGVLLARRDGPWASAVTVDLGPGDDPTTSAELAAVVAPLVVVDHEAWRVERALEAGLDARVGGFDLPLRADEPARVIRAMNVLRGYRAEAIGDAHARLGAALLPGGLLLDGSSDAPGGIVVVRLLRATTVGLRFEGILFSTDFARGFAPRLFRDWLPRDLRGRDGAGAAVHDLLARWTAAWEEVRATGVREPRAAFVASVARLPDLDVARAPLGDVVWRPRSDRAAG